MHPDSVLIAVSAVALSVVTVYSCLSLLYVAGSRFVVRYYLLTRYVQPTEARLAIYGAGDAGARVATVLCTTRAFDPVVFIEFEAPPHCKKHRSNRYCPPITRGQVN